MNSVFKWPPLESDPEIITLNSKKSLHNTNRSKQKHKIQLNDL